MDNNFKSSKGSLKSVIIMDDSDSPNVKEELAQVKHENKRLKDELYHLRRHSTSYEDNLNILSLNLSTKENQMKSYEHQISFQKEMINEKDNLLETFEQNNKELMKANESLKEENDWLKGELHYVKVEHLTLMDEVQTMKLKEEEIMSLLEALKEEKSRLVLEINHKKEEYALSLSSMNDLQIRNKELEEEKTELLEQLEVMKSQEEECSKISKSISGLFKASFDGKTIEGDISVPRKRSRFEFDEQAEHDLEGMSLDEGDKGLSLHEELCQSEIRQKQLEIEELQDLIAEKDNELKDRNELISNLKKQLEEASDRLITLDKRNDELREDYFSLKDEYEGMLELFCKPDGQGENKPLTGALPLSVTVKDGVQTTQPGPLRIIETVSIASQTDPVRILTPVLPPKSFEDAIRARSISMSDSDEEFPSLSPTDEPEGRCGLRLFSEHKNCDLDMDIYRKSKPSEVLDECLKGGDDPIKMTSTEGASNSDSDSTDSRDVNLNSKNFTDCNLFGNIKNSIRINEFKSPGYLQFKDSSFGSDGKEILTRDRGCEKFQTPEENNKDISKEEKQFENDRSPEADKDSNGEFKVDPIITSTPNHYSGGQDVLNISLPAGKDPSKDERDSNDRTYHIDLDLPLNGVSSLSDEEIEKKFQELGLAFRTDSMTLSKRLKVRKRQRDQAEINVETEVKFMQEKLDSLQYLCHDCQSLQLVTEMRKHLDVILASAVNLSSSAEAYGYVQNEEKISGAVSVMLQHVENVERIKSDGLKSDRLKADSKRNQFGSTLDDDRDDDRILRRRSIATTSLNGSSRRRASIASLPRLITTSQDNGGSVIVNQFISSNRSPNAIVRKLSSQSTNRILLNSSAPVGEQIYVRRESGGVLRYRKDNRAAESSMDYIEEFPERLSNQNQEDDLDISCDEDDNSASDNKKNLILQKLSRSAEDSRSNSDSLETLNILDCLRRLLEWNVVILSSARFRWPDSFRHYVPFVLTWYVIIVLATVFAGGLILGINGCCTYSRLLDCFTWSLLITFFIVVVGLLRRLLLRLILVLVSCLFLVGIYLVGSVICSSLQQLRREELESVLEKFGIYFEVRYPKGTPPI